MFISLSWYDISEGCCSQGFYWTNSLWLSYVRKIKYIKYNAQDDSVLLNKTVLPDICDALHFPYTWKILVWQHHYTKKEGFGRKNSSTLPSFFFIEMPVPIPESKWSRSCICVLGTSICFKYSVVLFVFHFIVYVPLMWIDK